MKSGGSSEDHHCLNFVVWRYNITKNRNQINKATLFEDLQQQSLKRTSHETQSGNNDVINILTFHITSNKVLEGDRHEEWKGQ